MPRNGKQQSEDIVFKENWPESSQLIVLGKSWLFSKKVLQGIFLQPSRSNRRQMHCLAQSSGLQHTINYLDSPSAHSRCGTRQPR